MKTQMMEGEWSWCEGRFSALGFSGEKSVKGDSHRGHPDSFLGSGLCQTQEEAWAWVEGWRERQRDLQGHGGPSSVLACSLAGFRPWGQSRT